MYLKSVTILHDQFPAEKREYPFTIPSLASIDTIEFPRTVTFFVGENGSGKSTLLEAIAYQCGFHTGGGGRNNFYQLDRAEAALGDYIRLSLLAVMRRMEEENGSQFIIATHSPILLGYPGAQILSFDSAPLREIVYEETEHYQITRRFLENRKRFLAELFDEA